MNGQLRQAVNSRFGMHVLVALLLSGSAFLSNVPNASAQSFSSNSDGSDGAYAPSGPAGTIVTFGPTQFSGTQVSANIFNFTTITIPAGVTVKLSGSVINGPVIWLAQGDVNIQGTIDLSGGKGHDATTNPFTRISSTPGAGGYPGGVGGSGFQASQAGGGPGGGAAGTPTSRGGQGTFSGNQFLIPLIGGSGGGGGGWSGTDFTAGGGAGGGAILIASSTQILVGGGGGTINANGGAAGIGSPTSGGGSGGAIRLVANNIVIGGTGNIGTVTAVGGAGNNGGLAGGSGRIRLEAFAITTGAVFGTQSQSAPFPLLLQTAGPATAKVISIGGVLISPNPSTFPDITINTASAVPVVIQTHNVPTTATVNLTILDENGVADTVIPAPPLGSCDQNNFCTTTVNVVFPFGASRGLTKVTWTP